MDYDIDEHAEGRMESMENGLVHIYCGEGKGKTTAAVGSAIRAAGAGWKVCFGQLMKDGNSSELSVLKNIEGLEVKTVVNHFGFTWNMTDEDKHELTRLHNEFIKEMQVALEKGTYQMIVLDEILSAYQYGLLEQELLLELLDTNKKEGGKAELILTGRNPAEALIQRADYITEMKGIRHPYEKGVAARMGIEW